MLKLIKSILLIVFKFKKNEVKQNFSSFSFKKWFNSLKNSEDLIEASLYFQILLNKNYSPQSKHYKTLTQTLLLHFNNLTEKEQLIYYIRASNQPNSDTLIIAIHEEDWILKMIDLEENLYPEKQ